MFMHNTVKSIAFLCSFLTGNKLLKNYRSPMPFALYLYKTIEEHSFYSDCSYNFAATKPHRQFDD